MLEELHVCLAAPHRRQLFHGHTEHDRNGELASSVNDSSLLTSIKLIYGGDNNWLGLSTACRVPRNFTLMDFEACVRQLWQNDWYDFRCEMYRVLVHFMMLLHGGTSARSAEYVINLRYRVSLVFDHRQSQST